MSGSAYTHYDYYYFVEYLKKIAIPQGYEYIYFKTLIWNKKTKYIITLSYLSEKKLQLILKYKSL